MEYTIHIQDKEGKCFAYHTVCNKRDLDKLTKKYLRMKGITLEITKRFLP